MSVLTVLQVDGGPRSSVQIVRCGSPNQVVHFGPQLEDSSVTFVEHVSTLVVGRCLCVCQLPILGRMCVCVLGGGLSSWVWHLGGQSDAKPT